jgi:hypothetical protein
MYGSRKSVLAKWGGFYLTLWYVRILTTPEEREKIPTTQEKPLTTQATLSQKSSLDLICHPSWNKQEVCLVDDRYCFFLRHFKRKQLKIDSRIWKLCVFSSGDVISLEIIALFEKDRELPLLSVIDGQIVFLMFKFKDLLLFVCSFRCRGVISRWKCFL